MILVDKEEVGLEELSQKLGITIPLDKIRKKPVFEIDPSKIVRDIANGPNATRSRAGIDFHSYFRWKNKQGKNVEIRFCTNRNPNPDTEGRTEIFSPKYVHFDGEAVWLNEDETEAVFFWLHFYNKTSPCRTTSQPVEYDFVDDAAKAEKKIEGIQSKRKAMLFADTLEGDALVIVAKGLRIVGANSMDERTLKAEVLEYALNKPDEFLKKGNSQVNQIEGLIIDAVDKEIFTKSSEYGTKTWKWNKGVHKGDLIVELSATGKDDVQALITHIQADINKFLPVLIDISKTVNATANAEKALAGVDILKQFGHKNVDEVIKVDDAPPPEAPVFPTDFNSAKEYVFYKTGKKTVSVCAALNKAIQAEEVSPENIDDWFTENAG